MIDAAPTRSSGTRGSFPFVLLLAVCASVLLVGTLGCGGSDAPQTTTTPEVADPEDAARQVKELREKEYKEKLSRLKKLANSADTSFDQRLRNARALKSQFPNKAAEVDKILEDTRKQMLEHAEKQLSSHLKEVDTYIDQGDFARAEDSMAEFLESTPRMGLSSFDETPAYEKWQEKIDEIALLKGAEGEADDALERARLAFNRDEFALAVAILDAYPEDYKTTEFYAPLEEKLADYYTDYLASKKEKESKKAIPWTDILIDEYLSAWNTTGPDSAWSVEDGVLSGENDSDKKIAAIFVDGDNWIEFNLRFEIKVSEGVVNLGLRQHAVRSGFGVWPFEVDENDTWIPILVTIEGADYTISRSDTFEELRSGRFRYTYPKGSFMFGLDAGEKLSLRNVQYQLISFENEEEGEDEGDD